MTPAFSSSGTLIYIAKFTGTAGDVGNSNMFQNGSIQTGPATSLPAWRETP